MQQLPRVGEKTSNRKERTVDDKTAKILTNWTAYNKDIFDPVEVAEKAISDIHEILRPFQPGFRKVILEEYIRSHDMTLSIR